MNMANSIKCITTLLKTLKVIKCVKKVEMCLIVSVIALIIIGTLRDNRKDISKCLMKLKKKVM